MKRSTFFLVAACVAALAPAALAASCCDGGKCCKAMKGVCKGSCGCAKHACCATRK